MGPNVWESRKAVSRSRRGRDPGYREVGTAAGDRRGVRRILVSQQPDHFAGNIPERV